MELREIIRELRALQKISVYGCDLEVDLLQRVEKLQELMIEALSTIAGEEEG